MNYDQYKLATPPYDFEPEEPPVKCELCGDDATCQVDIDPLKNPGRYMVDLCDICGAFERKRINLEIRNLKNIVL